jgi:hypothetical protein
VTVSAALVGFSWISLSAAIGMSMSLVERNREDLRATQIMLQKMEQIRLYNWDQLRDTTNYVKRTFQTYFDPASNGGPLYSGTVSNVVPASLPAAYRNKTRLITVSVTWTSNIASRPISHSRSMQTYVAEFGLNPYVDMY